MKKYIAQEEHIFKRISDGMILGSILYLGVNDDIENYIEIKEPKELEIIEE